jgi:hypothetical protein
VLPFLILVACSEHKEEETTVAFFSHHHCKTLLGNPDLKFFLSQPQDKINEQGNPNIVGFSNSII